MLIRNCYFLSHSFFFISTRPIFNNHQNQGNLHYTSILIAAFYNGESLLILLMYELLSLQLGSYLRAMRYNYLLVQHHLLLNEANNSNFSYLEKNAKIHESFLHKLRYMQLTFRRHNRFY
jgi:hypothetical protein